MLGYNVDQGTLNMKAASAVIMLRSAFDQIENIAGWLANHPKSGNVDPLVTDYNYTADEAYALRIFFETMQSLRTTNQATFEIGRKMTGLE